MVGGGSGEEERGLRSLRLSSENRDCYSKKGAISVRGLPWLSGREFRVNAWAEGEGCRDDGAANGRREGEREGRPIKEGFLPVVAPRSSSSSSSVVSSSPFLTRSDFNDFRKAGSHTTKQSTDLSKRLCDSHSRFTQPCIEKCALQSVCKVIQERSKHFILLKSWFARSLSRSARNPLPRPRKTRSTTAAPLIVRRER